MNRTTKFLLIFVVTLCVLFATAYLGYEFTTSDKNSIKNNLNDMVSTTTYPIVTDVIEDTPKEVSHITPNTIISYTKKEDDVIVNTFNSVASASLIGLTKEELAKTLDDVSIVSFDEKQVSLLYETKTKENEDSYIVGAKDGFVTIFYKDSDNNITVKDKTKILIENLPEQDIKLLEKGIVAKNESQLINIIEDYTS